MIHLVDDPRAVAGCRCCDGRGQVEAADGELRPCSRCRTAAFNAWADARRPKPEPAPHADFSLEPGSMR